MGHLDISTNPQKQGDRWRGRFELPGTRSDGDAGVPSGHWRRAFLLAPFLPVAPAVLNAQGSAGVDGALTLLAAGAPDPTAGIALLAGMAYFFSPCVWPLYPAYLAYLGGTAGASHPGSNGERRGVGGWSVRMLHGLAFVTGLGLVLVGMGATLSAIGQLLAYYRPVLEKIAGILIVIFGLSMAGRLRWSWLEREWRPGTLPRTPGLGASVAMGAAFGLGWTPCVGPVLASILVLAGSAATVAKGMMLLAVFTAGFAVPFLVLAALIDWLGPRWMKRAGPALVHVQRVSGWALVALGVLVFTGRLAQISTWLWEVFA